MTTKTENSWVGINANTEVDTNVENYKTAVKNTNAQFMNSWITEKFQNMSLSNNLLAEKWSKKCTDKLPNLSKIDQKLIELYEGIVKDAIATIKNIEKDSKATSDLRASATYMQSIYTFIGNDNTLNQVYLSFAIPCAQPLIKVTTSSLSNTSTSNSSSSSTSSTPTKSSNSEEKT